MTTWRIDRGGKIRELSESRLRRMLRRGKLTGVEVARPDDEAEWRPLHAWPIFQEEVAFAGDAENAALDRKIRGLGVHLLAFVLVVGAFTVNNGLFPPWAAFWGIGLGFHLVGTLPALRRRIQRSHASQAAQAAEAVPPDTQADTDPQLAALGAALAGLQQALAGVDEAPDVDLAALRRAGAELARKRGALAGALPPEGTAELEQALTAAEVRASVGGPGAADHAAEMRALAQRLTALREVGATLDRLRARERALLHEVEGLRLALLQASARSDDARPDLADHARRLAEEARAVDEVDAALDRARRAAAAQRAHP